MKFTRLRLLNERRGFLGLYLSDYFCAVVLLSILNNVLMDTRFQLLSFFITGFSLIALIPIRKSKRKGVIRARILSLMIGETIHVRANS